MLKQSELSEKLGFKKTDCRVSLWESGKSMPDLENSYKLAKVLGVFPHELYPELWNRAIQSSPIDTTIINPEMAPTP